MRRVLGLIATGLFWTGAAFLMLYTGGVFQ